MGTLRSALVAMALAALLGRGAFAGESDSPLKRIRDLEAAVAALTKRVAALEGAKQPVAAPSVPEPASAPDAVQRLRDLEAAMKALDARVTAIERSASRATPVPPQDSTAARVIDGRLEGIPPAKDYGRKHLIQATYDKFLDATTYTVRLDLRSDRGANIRLSAYWSALGQSPRFAPADVSLLFSRSQEDWRWLKFHDVIIVTGSGKRYSAEGKRDGSVVDGGVVEHVSIRMDVVRFLELVNSDEVDIRVGIDDLHLTPASIDALRDLASRMPPTVDPEGTK